jgi:starch synthase
LPRVAQVGSSPQMSQSDVVVANAGHIPWMVYAAEELNDRGVLRCYTSPAVFTEGDQRLARLPKPVATFVHSQVVRRQVPAGMPIRRVGTGFEIAAVLAARAAPSSALRRALADIRDLRFDLGVSRLMRPGDSAAYLTYGAGLRTIRRARALGAKSLVEQALHHHRFNESILQREARLQPEYAGTLQFHRPNARRRRRLDAEIAAADRTVVLSEFSKRTYVDAGLSEDRLVVTQLGVAADAFSEVARVEDGVFRVLFLGVLTQRKGLSYLVDGFRRAAIPDSELLLAGHPWGRGHPWRGAPGIRHIPWVERDALVDVFSSSDVLVLPSLAEGFARVILEAMAGGVPVIVTPNTGGADAVREGTDGYLVPIRDPDSIAERLLHLHRHPELRRQMGGEARKRAREFSWERYAGGVVEAIRSNG